MGRKRVFTQEVYEALEKGISTEPFLDFFADIPLHARDAFGDVGLENDLSNIEQYMRDVSDLNDYTEGQLKEIFQNVESVDRRYGRIFQAQADTVQAFDTVVKRLAEEIGNKNFVTDFDDIAFFASVAQEGNILLQMRWQEILQKPANEITQQEYMQLAELLIRSGDAELLEDMLNLCYDYSDVESRSEGGITVTVVSYNASEKLKELAEAVNMALMILEASCMAGLDINEDTQRNAIRINQLLQTFLPYSGALDIATTQNMQGDQKVTSERLIEICYTSDGLLQLQFFQYPGKNQVWIEQKPTVISISSPVSSQTGENKAKEEGFQYMATYIGNDTVGQAVSQEMVNQVLSTFIGEIPGSGIASSVQSIVSAGIDAAKNPTQACWEMAQVGELADLFDMFYVSSDINGDANLHTYSFYPGPETADWVKAFNEYMQNGIEEKEAQACGYNDLPNGELTVAYLVTYPNEVCAIFDMLDEKAIYNGEMSRYRQDITDIYQELKNE